jgi:hypothetical protein
VRPRLRLGPSGEYGLDFLAIPAKSDPLQAQGRHGDHQPNNRDDAMHGESPTAEAHPQPRLRAELGGGKAKGRWTVQDVEEIRSETS